MITTICFDVSTTDIGVCIYKNRNEFNTYVISLDKFSYETHKLLENIQTLKNKLRQIRVNEKVNLGIELSNFSNPELTQRFSFYSAIIIDIMSQLNDVVKIKVFNANEWQLLIGCKPQDDRETRKRKAREYSNLLSPHSYTQDEVDAYCMCELFDKIITTEQHKHIVQTEKKNKILADRMKLKLIKMINIRLNKINQLDKKKNSRQIDRLEFEISQFKEQLKNYD